MNKRFLTIMLALTVLTSAYANGDTTTLPNSESGTYSEERNAASAYVGTLNFYIGRMASTCQPLLKEADSFPKKLVATWQEQANNGRFVNAAAQYQASFLAAVEERSGFEGMLTVLKEIQLAVQGNGQQTVDDQLHGSDADKLTTCQRFVSNVESGALNVPENNAHYQTLIELTRLLLK